MKEASSNAENEQKPHLSNTALPLECATIMCFDNAASLVAAYGHRPQKNRRTVSLSVGTNRLIDLRAVSFFLGTESGFACGDLLTDGTILWIDLRAVTFSFGTDSGFPCGDTSLLILDGLCDTFTVVSDASLAQLMGRPGWAKRLWRRSRSLQVAMSTIQQQQVHVAQWLTVPEH